MGKKMLLLTDFSMNSWNAIQYAIMLYENHPCDFYILNTYIKDSTGFDNITLDPEESFNKLSENRSQKGLGDILQRISKIDRNIDHRFYVLSKHGLLIDAAKDIIMDHQIDMIFIGAKGTGNEQKNKYGKNTLDIIQNIRNCPVMIVPNSRTIGRPKEIVLAIDFYSDYDFLEMEQLAEMARLTNAKIKVLSSVEMETLNPNQYKNKVLLEKQLEGVDFSFHSLPNTNMDDVFNSLTEVKSDNIISYINEKRSLWERLGFRKPSLRNIGYSKHTPVLTLHG